MKIRDIIDRVEAQRPGSDIPLEDYIQSLNILDEDIYTNIVSAHTDDRSFIPHSRDDDTLLVPDMYGDLYCFWLFARIDLANSDVGGYTNNMILFNNLMKEYSGYYTRNHMPRQRGRVRWR